MSYQTYAKKGSYPRTIKGLIFLKNRLFSKGQDDRAKQTQQFINKLLQNSEIPSDPSEKKRWIESNVRRVAYTLCKRYNLQLESYEIRDEEVIIILRECDYECLLDESMYSFNHPSIKKSKLNN